MAHRTSLFDSDGLQAVQLPDDLAFPADAAGYDGVDTGDREPPAGGA